MSNPHDLRSPKSLFYKKRVVDGNRRQRAPEPLAHVPI